MSNRTKQPAFDADFSISVMTAIHGLAYATIHNECGEEVHVTKELDTREDALAAAVHRLDEMYDDLRKEEIEEAEIEKADRKRDFAKDVAAARRI